METPQTSTENLPTGSDIGRCKHDIIAWLKIKGVHQNMIPGFIRLLAYSLFMNPRMSLPEVNTKIRSHGWSGFELDENIFRLVVTYLTFSSTKGLEYRLGYWF